MNLLHGIKTRAFLGEAPAVRSVTLAWRGYDSPTRSGFAPWPSAPVHHEKDAQWGICSDDLRWQSAEGDNYIKLWYMMINYQNDGPFFQTSAFLFGRHERFKEDRTFNEVIFGDKDKICSTRNRFVLKWSSPKIQWGIIISSNYLSMLKFPDWTSLWSELLLLI